MYNRTVVSDFSCSIDSFLGIIEIQGLQCVLQIFYITLSFVCPNSASPSKALIIQACFRFKACPVRYMPLSLQSCSGGS